MGSLIVNYGVMGSSKSSNLMQEVHNLEESGKKVTLIKPSADTKANNKIHSRFAGEFNRPVDILLRQNETVLEAGIRNKINFLYHDFLVLDEAQFITEQQALELWLISKKTNLQIICYCLMTDFQANFFPASKILLSYADEKNELKRRCEVCGLSSAIANARKVDGVFVSSGDQIVIDGTKNVQYVSMCGNCYFVVVKESEPQSKKMFDQIIRMKALDLQDDVKLYTLKSNDRQNSV